ncbi:chaplin [Streptomyces collinus]|uniref:chaplin n=1 Tax=Streptomyces collinus TaxID=42684 RepID=UPI00364E95B1
MRARVTAGAGLAFAGTASANGGLVGIATDSAGVLSCNVIQIPIDISADVCGNSIDVIGLLNPASGNEREIKDRRTGRTARRRRPVRHRGPPPAAVVSARPADAARAPAS